MGAAQVFVLNPDRERVRLTLDWNRHSLIPCGRLATALDRLRPPAPELIEDV